jgi:hypothetical protein
MKNDIQYLLLLLLVLLIFFFSYHRFSTPKF